MMGAKDRPRVLTLKELIALPHKSMYESVPVVVEERCPVEVWTGTPILKWWGSYEVYFCYLRESHRKKDYYTRWSYGQTWRVWTAMPTYEEDEAAKWDEQGP